MFEIGPNERMYMDTEPLIRWMQRHGSSLILNWGEDTGNWEVAWISGGKRFVGVDPVMRRAMESVIMKAELSMISR